MNTPRTPLMQPTPPVGQEEAVEKMLVTANEIMGFVPDPLRLMGVSPTILAEFTEFLGHYETHPRLSSNLLAMMRYLVAAKKRLQVLRHHERGNNDRKWNGIG